MSNIITYEQFCAARKAKIEKNEDTIEVLDLDWTDEHAAIAAARDFYAQKEQAENEWRNQFDYE